MIEQQLRDEALAFLANSGRMDLVRRAVAISPSRPLVERRGRQRGDSVEPPAAPEGVTLMQVAPLLRARRKERGLSLGDLQNATGMTRGRLSRVENRLETNLTIGTLDRIAEALGLRLLVTLVEAAESAESVNAETPSAVTEISLAEIGSTERSETVGG